MAGPRGRVRGAIRETIKKDMWGLRRHLGVGPHCWKKLRAGEPRLCLGMGVAGTRWREVTSKGQSTRLAGGQGIEKTHWLGRSGAFLPRCPGLAVASGYADRGLVSACCLPLQRRRRSCKNLASGAKEVLAS